MPKAMQHKSPSKNAIKLKRPFFIFRKMKPAMTPVPIPMINGRNITPTAAAGDSAWLPFTALITEITVKNTITPITSSMAAKGIRVFVTGPSV